jgi:hypothetical protein
LAADVSSEDALLRHARSAQNRSESFCALETSFDQDRLRRALAGAALLGFDAAAFLAKACKSADSARTVS